MRYLFLLLILMIVANISDAQNHAEKKFIRFAIGKENIWYNEKIRPFDINEAREALNKDTLFDWKYVAVYEKRGLPDSLVLVLTKEEHAFINRQLDKMKGFILKNDLFKNSLAIDFETMGAYKKAHYGKLSFNPDDYKNGGYAFTKPIFIRHNTVCFFYLTFHDGGYLRIYIKKGKNWELKFTPYFWVS